MVFTGNFGGDRNRDAVLGYRPKLPEINCSNRICEKRPYSVSFSKRFNTVDRQADFEQYLGLAMSGCLSGARLTIARENK